MDPRVRLALERSRAGDSLRAGDVAAILGCPDADLPDVLRCAADLRDEGLSLRGLEGVVTYSRKVFIPLTRLCRYRCSYCTFVETRARTGAEYLTEDEVLAVAGAGREWGCTEALFTLGESPEERHAEAAAWLRDRGFESTVDYLIHSAAAVVLGTGLLPHVNPGAVTEAQMARLRDVSASQGLMMEELSDRLLEPGEAHAGAPGKAAGTRLEQLAFAARTKTPFTTGFLIGIGETISERAGTICKIRDACAGQIQEVIVQNFRAKPDTPMRSADEPSAGDMVRAIAAARLALGPQASVQAPPNLTPAGYAMYLDAGINDWGGVSPLTPDHVNPEMPWPRIDELADECAARGFTLRQRLPVYPEYVRDDRLETWIAPAMRRHVLAAADASGLAREERWYAGEGWTPVLRAAQPSPKRRALALAAGRPDATAQQVSAGFAERVSGYGAPPPQDTVGFDEMLPDVPSRTVFAHERAGPAADGWLSPYRRGRTGRVSGLLERAREGERLDHREVERLFRAEGGDLEEVIATADEIRREVNGEDVTYVVNRNVTYTNVCHTGCGFCGFARPSGHEDAYYFEPHQVAEKAREAWDLGATEVCIQGGIHPHNTGRVYLEIARAVKAAAPGIHLHGFSPLEITVGATTLEISIERFLSMLKESGLDSIPGTAAEILDERVRPRITPQKLSARDWIELMRTAHGMGIRSTATIMFGHIDDPAAWATHLLRLRDLQAETGGFTELVPLPFVHHRSPIFMRGASRTGPTWRECVKMHAVSRIVLHPIFENIQASWVKLGVEGVVALLDCGVNDFGGTLGEEHISRLAGASHGLGLSVQTIRDAVSACGRSPRERTTLYGRAEKAGLRAG